MVSSKDGEKMIVKLPFKGKDKINTSSEMNIKESVCVCVWSEKKR